MKSLWPLMLKSTHRAVQVENHVLRDALREANAELLKHRQTIGSLAAGSREATEQLERVGEIRKYMEHVMTGQAGGAHPLDECVCGDHRKDHPLNGACMFNSTPGNGGLTHGFKECDAFVLLKAHNEAGRDGDGR